VSLCERKQYTSGFQMLEQEPRCQREMSEARR
jgi:hypothetical protein